MPVRSLVAEDFVHLVSVIYTLQHIKRVGYFRGCVMEMFERFEITCCTRVVFPTCLGPVTAMMKRRGSASRRLEVAALGADIGR